MASRGRMRVSAAVAIGVAAVLALAFGWLTRPQYPQAEDLGQYRPDPVNGEQLFHAGGCASCHGSDLAGGLEIPTAFGTFRVPNISPDPVSGIGGWTATDFVNAVQHGVSPAGEHYYPAFPYTSYARMRLQDVVDLWSYIRSFAPVRSTVPDHSLGLPWSLRRGIGLWKRRYLDSAPVVAIDAGRTELARGRYLAEAVGHCAECHTPRDAFGGLQRSAWLGGGPGPDGEGRVPNITSHEDGLAQWSERDIVRYLRSGFTPEYDTVGGSMAKVQENIARLSDDDLAAIAAYLKAVPGLPDP